ncbi:craniofacial development protein 2-like [Watersipora subatra]|uniref:craniofacial development protein 2-like n=1 Tax=Watersipora subatra TaxID=2589382 RepID=UPI00355BFDFF
MDENGIATIDLELSRRGVDIVELQETRLAGTCTIKEANYTFFWIGRPPEESRIYGTGFAISNRPLCSSQTPSGVNDRISVLKVNTKQGTIFTVNAYAPTLAASSDDKDCFYHTLEDTIRKAFIWERVILLGDFNARIVEDDFSWPKCIGHFGVENGQRLIQLCCKNNLVVTSTLFPGKPHRKVSWCHPRSKTWHQLDFVITRSKHKEEFLNTRLYHSADCDSDHNLVVSKLRLEPRTYHNQIKASKKIDVSNLRNQKLQKCYHQSLDKKIAAINTHTSPEEHWEQLSSSIHNAGSEAFGLKKRQDPDWYSQSRELLEPALDRKRAAMLKYQSRATRQTFADYHSAKSEAQRTVRL